MGAEQNKIRLMSLLKKAGNDCCADCGISDPPPDWASVTLGTFVCLQCSGIHRGLSNTKSVIKSLRLDRWKDEHCEIMAKIGNANASKTWEKNVPAVWERPGPDSLPLIIKEWIYAKYERQEFLDGEEKRQTYLLGNKEGSLKKRDKYRDVWKPRYFILDAARQQLLYYAKQDDVQPIGKLDIKTLNVILCDEDRTGKKDCLQLCEPTGYQTRNYFLSSENPSELFDWYLCIRGAKYRALNLKDSQCPQSVISAAISKPFIMEGYIEKTGPKDNDVWKKRWVSIDRRCFMYCADKMEAIARTVVLGQEEAGFSVREGMVGKHPSGTNCFVVVTPTRSFNFKTTSKEKMEGWMAAFKKAMSSFPTLTELVSEELTSSQDGLSRLSIASTLSNFSSASSIVDH